MVDAVVLAGSINNGPLHKVCAVQYEALIPIGPKLMVEYVVDALTKSKKIDRIVIVGPCRELAGRFTGDRISVVEAGETLMDSFTKGVNQLPGTDRVLVVTADIPLLTPLAIDSFIEACNKERADLYYPIVPRETVESRYAQTQRTYVVMREGVFTGGNIFLVNPAAAKDCITKGQEIINLRKSPFKLCRLVGFMFLIKFLLHLLSIKEVQEKASNLLGLSGLAIILDYPEVGVDVDKPSDLALVSQTLGVV
ncbi:nucleotidyltransferase family protein [Desulfolucanica intricata]|uniref:nucleotidyltransferase family protein n=1 Tax=Desulfolucanica intricata TaxID=1285191 RepID=UPI00082D2060|nr:nucleotidyltransferase family protein [Desulfolucanica intricata]